MLPLAVLIVTLCTCGASDEGALPLVLPEVSKLPSEVARLQKDESIEDRKIATSVEEEQKAVADEKTAEMKVRQAALKGEAKQEKLAEVEEKKAEVRVAKAEAEAQDAEAKKAALLSAKARLTAAEAEVQAARLDWERQGANKVADLVKSVNVTESLVDLEALHHEENVIEGIPDVKLPPAARHFHFMSMLMLGWMVACLFMLYLRRRQALQQQLLEACGLDGVLSGKDDPYARYRVLA